MRDNNTEEIIRQGSPFTATLGVLACAHEYTRDFLSSAYDSESMELISSGPKLTWHHRLLRQITCCLIFRVEPDTSIDRLENYPVRKVMVTISEKWNSSFLNLFRKSLCDVLSLALTRPSRNSAQTFELCQHLPPGIYSEIMKKIYPDPESSETATLLAAVPCSLGKEDALKLWSKLEDSSRAFFQKALRKKRFKPYMLEIVNSEMASRDSPGPNSGEFSRALFLETFDTWFPEMNEEFEISIKFFFSDIACDSMTLAVKQFLKRSYVSPTMILALGTKVPILDVSRALKLSLEVIRIGISLGIGDRICSALPELCETYQRHQSRFLIGIFQYLCGNGHVLNSPGVSAAIESALGILIPIMPRNGDNWIFSTLSQILSPEHVASWLSPSERDRFGWMSHFHSPLPVLYKTIDSRQKKISHLQNFVIPKPYEDNPNYTLLPELLKYIYSFLNTGAVTIASLVCTTWFEAATNEIKRRWAPVMDSIKVEIQIGIRSSDDVEDWICPGMPMDLISPIFELETPFEVPWMIKMGFFSDPNILPWALDHVKRYGISSEDLAAFAGLRLPGCPEILLSLLRKSLKRGLSEVPEISEIIFQFFPEEAGSLAEAFSEFYETNKVSISDNELLTFLDLYKKSQMAGKNSELGLRFLLVLLLRSQHATRKLISEIRKLNPDPITFKRALKKKAKEGDFVATQVYFRKFVRGGGRYQYAKIKYFLLKTPNPVSAQKKFLFSELGAVFEEFKNPRNIDQDILACYVPFIAGDIFLDESELKPLSAFPDTSEFGFRVLLDEIRPKLVAGCKHFSTLLDILSYLPLPARLEILLSTFYSAMDAANHRYPEPENEHVILIFGAICRLSAENKLESAKTLESALRYAFSEEIISKFLQKRIRTCCEQHDIEVPWETPKVEIGISYAQFLKNSAGSAPTGDYRTKYMSERMRSLVHPSLKPESILISPRSSPLTVKRIEELAQDHKEGVFLFSLTL
jgi:hypothetical protein